ncbi:MAG: Mpo1-like protein [Vicinamibacterales bacterium]
MTTGCHPAGACCPPEDSYLRPFAALTEQRWDDHRFYHHNRMNQALHLLSALAFLTVYGLLFLSPALAVLLAWLVAMPSRQIGHFFFEPHEYDHVNDASHEHKEAIKVGYNLFRKIVLLTIWALSPLLLAASPSLWGLLSPAASFAHLADNVAMIWLAIAVGAVLFRTLQLFVIRDVQTGLVWCTKILTDPFHDVKLYHRAPLQVLRGELYEPAVLEPRA